MHRYLHTLLVAVALISCLLSGQGTAHATGQPPAPVRVEGGLIAGTQDGGVERFLGRPYAAPPVGDPRWRALRPVEAWPGARTTRTFSPERTSADRGTRRDFLKPPRSMHLFRGGGNPPITAIAPASIRLLPDSSG